MSATRLLPDGETTDSKSPAQTKIFCCKKKRLGSLLSILKTNLRPNPELVITEAKANTPIKVIKLGEAKPESATGAGANPKRSDATIPRRGGI